MGLKEKLTQLRKNKGLSQLELAEMMGVSRQAVSRWENGLSVPSTDKLKQLSDLYSVSLDSLLSNSEETATSQNPEIGETITINAHYTPTTASVDFGFFAPDGLFYPISASNGYINVTIEVTQHGYYRFGIHNKSSNSISAFGIVTY